MFKTRPKRKATKASLRSISRTDIEHLNAKSLRLVFHKLAQLIKRPAMQSGAHLSARLNCLANIFQILHHNLSTIVFLSFLDNGFSNTVIDVTTRALFSAGDLPQSL